MRIPVLEMMLKRTLFLLLFPCIAYGQGGNVKDTAIFTPLVGFHYSFQMPAGDLAQRFGYNSSIGGKAEFKLASQWIMGLEYNFIFGNQVRERNMLDSLMTSNGQIINSSGQYAQILLFERGHAGSVTFGKNFPWFGPNLNSGIIMKLGVGYIQHKIRIEHQNDYIPQLEEDYAKGYDRLTGGLLLNQFIGYQHLSNNKFVNFYAGVEVMEGITRSLRSFNFDTMEQDTRTRLDMLIGLKVGWLLPVYKRAPQDFYYD